MAKKIKNHNHRVSPTLEEKQQDKVIQNLQPPIGQQPKDKTPYTTLVRGLKYLLIGAPKNLWDRSLFHKVALIPLLAWVGMGADGISSSSYGPEESFKALLQHPYLIPLVVIATMLTIIIISIAYSRIIENFPHGGGGYVVASKLLGPHAGLVSGCALMVDYMLTITVSVAVGGNLLFSMIPVPFQPLKIWIDILLLGFLIVMNLRGVKESVMAMFPVFFIFVVTHIILIASSFFLFRNDLSEVTGSIVSGCGQGYQTFGFAALLFVFLKAYSMGAGTYTGLEAVSNGMGILREPQIESGKRTMLYMAASLCIASAGLFLSYLVVKIIPDPNQTLNAVLAYKVFKMDFFGPDWLQFTLIILTLLSEAGLLMFAAQTGFIDGPRVMANMAIDSWFPKRFSALSERFTIRNGVFLFGAGSIFLVLFTKANVDLLVIMYSINVFITFSLSQLSLIKMYWDGRAKNRNWLQKTFIPLMGFILCVSILLVMIFEKFAIGGWMTIAVTICLILLCLWIKHYYRTVSGKIRRLDEQLKNLPVNGKPTTKRLSLNEPTAILLVQEFGSVGVHSLFSIFHMLYPGYFKNVVFVSVGMVNSGNFKGTDSLKALEVQVIEDLKKYKDLALRMGIPADYEMEIGTDVVESATKLCLRVAKRFPRVVVFGGKLIFQQERWYAHLMHNETATAIQNRLQWEGLSMSILPVRVFG